MKWNCKIETLYMLAIVHQKNIESLRSLSGEHVALLEHIRDKSLEAIESKYGVKKNKIRGFFFEFFLD
jgi:m7GpppX diphosphatase